MMNDAELVKQFKKGNREAFSELVRRHSRPLTMLILKMVRDPEEARDISQDVFLKAFEALPRFMMASSFKTWLYKIAMNTVTDHVRKRRPNVEPEALERLIDPGRSASDQLEHLRYVEFLREAVQRLPEKQRATLQLRVYEDMDYKEIARVLGGTAGGARGNFFQAVKTLRRALAEKGQCPREHEER